MGNQIDAKYCLPHVQWSSSTVFASAHIFKYYLTETNTISICLLWGCGGWGEESSSCNQSQHLNTATSLGKLNYHEESILESLPLERIYPRSRWEEELSLQLPGPRGGRAQFLEEAREESL